MITPSGRTKPLPPEPDARRAYIALALVPGIGARRLALLLSHFPDAIAVLDAAARISKDLPDAVQRVLALARRASFAAADVEIARCDALDVLLLTPADPDFPAMLRSIPDPPIMLFLRGQIRLLALPAVAIIGSRNHTRYGSEVAAQISAAAALGGVAVVSGMARGLDAIAHQAALDHGGGTIGVLGNGIGVIYPPGNASLYARVQQDGLLLTEHPPGENPTPGSFPRRNRLISGLARVVVVVEAAEASGTLITVGCALEQGREVMAVPGPITVPTSAGTNRLLRDGAEPLLSVSDLMAKFLAPAPGASVAEVAGIAPSCTLSGDEAQAFNLIGIDPRHVDDLALATGFPIGHLLAVLCGLELGGLVEQLPGALFRRPAMLRA